MLNFFVSLLCAEQQICLHLIINFLIDIIHLCSHNQCNVFFVVYNAVSNPDIEAPVMKGKRPIVDDNKSGDQAEESVPVTNRKRPIVDDEFQNSGDEVVSVSVPKRKRPCKYNKN
jgi:hypothetical protein